MNSIIKKCWNIATNALVILVVIIAILLAGARLIGLQVYTVLSGSMEPEYHTGSIIYVKDVDPNSVEVGDPITFVMNESLVVATHRVIDIDSENRLFYTKGDANKIPDANPVPFENLLGKPIFTIPLLGYLANFIQNPPGLYISVGLAVLLIIICFVPDIIDQFKHLNKQENKEPLDAKSMNDSELLDELLKKLSEKKDE